MKRILDIIEEQVRAAFSEAGYDASYGKVSISDRPDLCQYQCNGAMAAAREYHKAPFMIADDVVGALCANVMFDKVVSVKPGFINITVSPSFLSEYVNEMRTADKFGLNPPENVQKIVIDYGGPNVAKPLHVGHLRAAVIGESVKRIARFAGHDVIGIGDFRSDLSLQSLADANRN